MFVNFMSAETKALILGAHCDYLPRVGELVTLDCGADKPLKVIEVLYDIYHHDIFIKLEEVKTL